MKIRVFSFVAAFLLIAAGSAYSAEFLFNTGFESGSFAPWQMSWWTNQAGAQIQTNPLFIHQGSYGLYEYTDTLSGLSFSATYQERPAQPGQIATASAWIITTGTWAAGSKACVRIEFRNDTNPDPYSPSLASYNSNGVTTANSGWVFDTLTTPPAPAGTTLIRFRCFLVRPSGSGQSQAAFDDCSLTLSDPAQTPVSDISPAALGIKKSEVTKSFKIKNTGTGTLNWSTLETESWITNISPSSGSLASGIETTVTVTVSRTGLTDESYKGLIDVSSNGGNQEVVVYMDMPVYAVPSQPSIAYRDGYRLMLRKRLPNGTLDTVRPYTIKGTAWSPSGIGSAGDVTTRRNEFGNWYAADIQLMKEAGINTVYTFIDMWTDSRGIEVLDNLYKNGIMAVITADEDGSDNTTVIAQVVNAYKNHPAILMWALGNEWNLWRPDRPFYYAHYSTLTAAANAMQANTLQIKSLDTNHPVASILGEINYPTQGDVNNIVNNICTAVDVWGANIYRGPEFYGLFTEWNSMSAKPLFLSEFGTDVFHATGWWPVIGYEDQPMQADFDHSLWLDLVQELSANDPAKVCLGGTVFEWNDEWWKTSTGDPNVHELDGYYTDWNPAAHPDSFANEEWFGIVDINRKIRESYNTFKEDFNNPMLDPIGKKTVYEGLPLQFTVTAFDPDSDPLALTASGLPSGATFNASAGTFSWTPNYTQAVTYFVHFEVTDGTLKDFEDVEIKVENVLVFGTIYTKPGAVLIPLEGATISVKNIYRTTTYASAVTDANGKFYVVATLPDNNYIIEIAKESYSLLWGITVLRNNQALPLAMTLYPPLFASMPDTVSVDENTPLSITISATDQNNDKLSFSATNLPEGATLTNNNNNTANFSWTPDNTQAGAHSVNFEVTDSLLSSDKLLVIDVKNVNNPPEISLIPDYSVYEGKAMQFTITAQDPDAGDTLTFSSDNLPQGSALNSSTGEFSWTPGFNQQGIYAITFKVSDGNGGEDSAPASITVINSSLYGSVFDGFTKLPIPNTTVTVIQRKKTIIVTTTTDNSGNYCIPQNLPTGSYDIHASAAGYSAKTVKVGLIQGNTIRSDIYLKRIRHK